MSKLPAMALAAAVWWTAPSSAGEMVCPPLCPPPGPNEVRIFVPPFKAQSEPLGRAVSSILGLQTWQTLQIGPANNGEKSAGTVMFARELHFQPNDRGARLKEIVKELKIGSQLILWGSATPYGDSVVVFPWLLLDTDARKNTPQLWTLKVSNITVEAPLPTRSYEFEPIVLKPDILARYSSPDGEALYKDPEGRQPMTDYRGAPLTVRYSLTALRQERSAALVRADTQAGFGSGWIMLPELGQSRTEVIDFVAGLVRIYRGDWNGAITMMNRVIENENTPTEIRVDSYLYKAMATSNLDRYDADSFAAAEALVSEKQSITIYETMADIARAMKADAQARPALLKQAQKRLKDRAWTFAENDPWYAKASQAITYLINSATPAAH